MTRGHWLDPLARKILEATGQLPKRQETSGRSRRIKLQEIEKELIALKKKQGVSNSNLANLQIDVNRANFSDWQKLPKCSENMAELMIKLQQGGVQLSCEEELFQLLELPNHLKEQWSPHLIFRWYGEPISKADTPIVDINNATSTELKNALKLNEKGIQTLLKERQRRPFKNLADFQERLLLPASIIENLIGKVRFGLKKSGPVLPSGWK